MKKTFLLGMTILAMLAMFFMSKKNQLIQARQEEQTIPAPIIQKSALTEKKNLVTKSAFILLRFGPTKEQYLEAAKKNLHRKPQILFTVAHELADKMDRAISSEQYAKKLSVDLHTCALDENLEQADPVKLICAVNLSTLAKHYPSSIQEMFLSLQKKIPAAMKEDLELLL